MGPDDLILSGRLTLQKEARALAGFEQTLDESFAEACRLIFDCQGTVLTSGMGKSGLVARKWAATFAGTGTKAYFLNAAEASHGDLGLIRPEDVLIALSYSGETEELGPVLRHARESGVRSIGVTRNPDSSLARQVSILLSINLSEEACPLKLAPTTSTTIMMALGDALAVTLMQMRGFTERDFARLHPGGSLGRKLWLRVSELMHKGETIPRVRPDTAMEDVLVEMTRKRLGLVVVMEGPTISGVITDGDLRRHFQQFKAATPVRASDLMTRDPKRIPETALAVEAREMMEKNSIHQLLIVDERGNLVGVVHLHDLLKAKVL
jgi:arabinose-5-phosphate isomerase